MAGCGKKISVKDSGGSHTSFCGCEYKGLHLCRKCLNNELKKSNDVLLGADE